MKKYLRWIILGALLLLALLFIIMKKNGKGDEFKTVAVTRGNIVEKALAVGTIEPVKEIKVKSIISGNVAEVFFKVGDLLKKDAPLFRILPNPTPLEYTEARRGMEMAEVGYLKTREDWNRKMGLFRANIISASEIEITESTYKESLLRYNMAKERLELLEKGRIRMAERNVDSVIRSPISGIVLQQSVYEGDPVVPLTNYQPGTDLCSLADMGKLLFKGTVDEIDVGKIEPLMPADIQIGALLDTKIEGRLERIYPKAKKDGNATLFDIEIAIVKVAGKTLRAGYSATAYVRIQERQGVLLIPERLITFASGKKIVEVADGRKALKREIETGLSDGLNVEVRSGLKEGELVIERPPREIGVE